MVIEAADAARPEAPRRLGRALEDVRRRGSKALVPYVMLGDPDLASSLAVAAAMAAAGADAIELGLPFSDPLADGPVIQAAGQRALRGGFRIPQALEALAALRRGVSCPLAVMTYVNPVLQRGSGRFVAEAARAGADGLIVPDLPLEESGPLGAACRAAGMDLVLMVAPTSTSARIAAVARAASGFIYCVSVAGVTGSRADTLARVPATIARVREHTALPLLVGFGIDGPEKAAVAAAVADGVIVASWIVRAVAELGPDAGPAHRAELAGGMVGRLRAALDQGAPGAAGPRP